jgi:hypothetical protein
MKLEWYVVVGAGGGGGFVPVPPVVKSHWFVTMTPLTLMSKRT